MHEFHHQHRLADTGTAEQPGLAAADERAEEVDDLDAGGQHRARRHGVAQGGWLGENVAVPLGAKGFEQVEWLAEHIEHPAKAVGGDGDMQRGAGIIDRHASPYPRRAVQGDGADTLGVQVLVDLEQNGAVVIGNDQGLVDGGQVLGADVDHRSVHGVDHTDGHGRRGRRSHTGIRAGGGWSDRGLIWHRRWSLKILFPTHGAGTCSSCLMNVSVDVGSPRSTGKIVGEAIECPSGNSSFSLTLRCFQNLIFR